MADGFTRKIRGLGEGSIGTQNRPNIQNENYSYYKVDKERESYKHKGGAWDPNRSFSNQYNEKRRNNSLEIGTVELEYNNLNKEINDFRKEHEAYKSGKENSPYGTYGDQGYRSYEEEVLNRHREKKRKKEFINSMLGKKDDKFKNKNKYSKAPELPQIKFNYPWMIKMILVVVFVICVISGYLAINSNDSYEDYDFQGQYEYLIRK